MHYDNYNLHCVISIHALLAESDRVIPEVFHDGMLFLSTLSLRRATSAAARGSTSFSISIHALLAESDGQTFACWYIKEIFLSTLSLRRATPWTRLPKTGICDFYPRSPCGERQDQNCASSSGPLFLSTLSLRRATTAAVRHTR